MNKNSSCKWCISLSVHPAEWPPSYLMVIAKLCMVIVRQEKPCSVCIFRQALPPGYGFSTRGSSPADHSWNCWSFLIHFWASCSGSSPWHQSHQSSLLRGQEHLEGGKTVGVSAISAGAGNPPQLGSVPYAMPIHRGKFRKDIKSTGTTNNSWVLSHSTPACSLPCTSSTCRSKVCKNKPQNTEQLNELPAEPGWQSRGRDSVTGSAWHFFPAFQLYNLFPRQLHCRLHTFYLHAQPPLQHKEAKVFARRCTICRASFCNI